MSVRAMSVRERGVATARKDGRAAEPPLRGAPVRPTFGWSYAAVQVPGGLFPDTFGSGVTYGLSVVLRSLVTAAQGLVSGVGSLLALRLGLGVAEAPCLPANSRVVATWFPQRERAMATGVCTVGGYGPALLSPPLCGVVGTWGWRSPFFLAGALGVLFDIGWWATYKEPHGSRRVDRAEPDRIAARASTRRRRSSPPRPGCSPAGSSWTLLSDVAPAGLLGLTGNILNTAAMLASILTPLVVGAVVAVTGPFAGALGHIGAFALIGALSHIVVIGGVRRIELV